MGDVITLKDILAPSFYRPYNDFITGRKSTLCFAGGRGSTKSSCISVCILLGLERDRRRALELKRQGDPRWRSELTHAICLRKVANTLADSVYAQFQWAAEKLHLTDKYVFLKTPLMIKRKGTDQRIMFRGLDDPQRLKSLRFPFSYGRYLWGEELAEYDCMEEILDVQRSVQRGGHDFVTFFSYNPPETSANWVNYRIEQIAREDPTFGFYKSDYRSVPREWLGDKFFRDAEILRRINERAYRHQYLGEVTGNGGSVFPNVRAVTLSDADIARFDLIRWGCDFGLRDPTVLAPIYYNKVTHSIVIFDEIYKSDMSLDDMDRSFKQMHDVKYKSYEYIIADCAGATLIQTLRQRNLQMIPCSKKAGSIEAGIKFLQSLTSIDIDPRRAPNAYAEFTQYEYEKNKAGLFTGRLPDCNNHFLDACVTGDTVVHTPNGDVPIVSLVGTDGTLLGYDDNGNVVASKFTNCRKTRENSQTVRLETSSGIELCCTDDHRILTPEGYRHACELSIGSPVVTVLGVSVITSISPGPCADVYDLEVPSTHNFIVNGGLVVHNCRYALEKLIFTTSMFG